MTLGWNKGSRKQQWASTLPRVSWLVNFVPSHHLMSFGMKMTWCDKSKTTESTVISICWYPRWGDTFQLVKISMHINITDLYLEMILSWSDRATQQGQVQKVILCLSLTLCFRVNLPLKGQRPWPLHPPRLPTTHHPTPISSGYSFPKPCGEIGWGANQHLAPPSVLLHSNWWMVQLHPVSLS